MSESGRGSAQAGRPGRRERAEEENGGRAAASGRSEYQQHQNKKSLVPADCQDALMRSHRRLVEITAPEPQARSLPARLARAVCARRSPLREVRRMMVQ